MKGRPQLQARDSSKRTTAETVLGKQRLAAAATILGLGAQRAEQNCSSLLTFFVAGRKPRDFLRKGKERTKSKQRDPKRGEKIERERERKLLSIAEKRAEEGRKETQRRRKGLDGKENSRQWPK